MNMARAAIALGIPFVAHVPCGKDIQPSKWPDAAKIEYYRLLSKASRVDVLDPGAYSPAAMKNRNISIVNWSTVVVAVWNGQSGGTSHCVNYANKLGRPVINLWGLVADSPAS